MADTWSDARFADELDKLSELGAKAEFDAFHVQLRTLFQQCRNGAQLWALASTAPFAEAVFCEDGPTSEVVRYALDKVNGWSDPESIAAAMALSTRMLAVHPGMTVLDETSVGRKAWLTDVIGDVRNTAASAMSSDHRAVRIACAHTLGCVPPLDEDDVRRLEALLADPNESCVATALLSLAAASELDGVDLSHVDTTSLLVSCALVGARVSRGDRVESDAALVLACAMEGTAPLPPEWGWRWEDGRAEETLAHLALKIAYVADVTEEAAAILVGAISKWVRGGSCTEYLQRETLLRLAFGDPIEAPRLGLTLAETSETQREALRALISEPGHIPNVWRLGFSERHFSDFLSGEGALFKPFAVPTPDGDHSWHLARLWRAFVVGEVSEDDAAHAIIAGLEPRDWLEAVCDPHRGNLLMMTSGPRSLISGDAVLRDEVLIGRVLRDFISNGFDAEAALSRMLRARKRWPTALGVAFLHAYATTERSPPIGAAEYIARVSKYSPPESPLHELVEELEPTLRAAVRAQVDELGRA